jgi:hypothetical protein
MEVLLQKRLKAMTSKSGGKGQSGSTTSIEIMTVVIMAFTMHVVSVTFCGDLY